MSPQETRALESRIRECLRRGDGEGARALLERLRREHPGAAAAQGLELEILLATKRFEEAAKVADRLVAAFPASPRVLYLAGRAASKVRRYAEAIDRLEESQRLHPHDRTLRELARALTHAGKLEAAEPILRGIVARRSFARMDLAWLYERRGEFEKARREVERYLAGRPDDAYARSRLLSLRAREMPLETVRQEIEELASLGEPLPGELLPRYAEGLLKSGDGDRLREFVSRYERELEPWTAGRMGWECYRLGAWDLALELFLIAVPRQQGNAKFRRALESAARRCGRSDEVSRLLGE